MRTLIAMLACCCVACGNGIHSTQRDEVEEFEPIASGMPDDGDFVYTDSGALSGDAALTYQWTQKGEYNISVPPDAKLSVSHGDNRYVTIPSDPWGAYTKADAEEIVKALAALRSYVRMSTENACK